MGVVGWDLLNSPVLDERGGSRLDSLQQREADEAKKQPAQLEGAAEGWAWAVDPVIPFAISPSSRENLV